MSTYIIYNNNTGEILNVHREYLQGSEETTELNDEEVLAQIEGLMPAKIKIGILSVKKEPEPTRDYSFYVDIKTKKLIKIKSRPVTTKYKKPTTKSKSKKKAAKTKTAKRRVSK